MMPAPERFYIGQHIVHDVHGLGVVCARLGTDRVMIQLLPSLQMITPEFASMADDEWTEIKVDRDDAPEPVADREFRIAQERAFKVEYEADRIRILDAAREKVAAEKAGDAPPFDAGLLSDILARPPEPPHRVEGLIPSEAGTIVVAQRKTGKTTFNLNLARCLITGEDFLGRFPVRTITGRVGFLNFEVSAAMLGRWADEVGVPRDRLYLVNLRGRRNPLAAGEDRDQLAAQLVAHEVDSLIVDPFGRAYTGKSQNDNGEVGTFLGELDRFARGEVGAVDVILTVHAGWDGERTRGASALEDWGDSIVTLTRSDKDDDQSRYMRAMGRDVDIDEDRLTFDPVTRLLSMSGQGSRRQASATSAIPAVLEYVAANPDCSKNAVETALVDDGLQRQDVRQALLRCVSSGQVEQVRRSGKGGGFAHRISNLANFVEPRQANYVTSPTSSMGEVEVTRLELNLADQDPGEVAP